MITAVDTNILLDILVPNEQFYEASGDALEEATGEGSIVISDIVVYAELCIHFENQRDCDVFLESNEIRVQVLTREAHFLASRAWRRYRQQGGKRTRILAAFLIGAHARKQATRLLSRDRGFYRKLFPSLDLVGPSGATMCGGTSSGCDPARAGIRENHVKNSRQSRRAKKRRRETEIRNSALVAPNHGPSVAQLLGYGESGREGRHAQNSDRNRAL